MADSKRKQIAAALLERLAAIQKVAGYHTDAGLHVTYGTQRLADDPLPSVTLRAGDCELVEKNLSGKEIRRWQFAASGLQNDDVDAPLALEDLVADIKRALFKGPIVLLEGEPAQVESFGGEIVTDPEEGGKHVACTVPFAVRYFEEYGAP